MTLKDQIAADVQTVFLNTDEFAEKIIYNGKSIAGLVFRGDAPGKGNVLTTDGQSDQCILRVAIDDVPSPKVGDRVTDETGKKWIVKMILSSGAGMHRLACVGTGTMSPWVQRNG